MILRKLHNEEINPEAKISLDEVMNLLYLYKMSLFFKIRQVYLTFIKSTNKYLYNSDHVGSPT